MNKRPLRWQLDDKFGTRPLFDLLLGGPSGYSVSEWVQGIGVHLVALLRPSGRAYLRWHWMYHHGIGDRTSAIGTIDASSYYKGWSADGARDDGRLLARTSRHRSNKALTASQIDLELVLSLALPNFYLGVIVDPVQGHARATPLPQASLDQASTMLDERD